ncbi:MAG TPA: carboxypeptidase-like regulatory domain-containing protein [Pyrinomonadaceae bacterium]|nr:carboxypeptidase-like regulatory domain-containing protein [Pyrinomonadaceae bacterium]
MTPQRAARFALLLLLVGISLLLPARQAHAQSGATGSLTGVVQDANGAVLLGASVTVKNAGTALTRTVTTNEEGRWTVPVLPVGEYEVTYELSGFKKLIREKVEVEAAVPRSLEDRLDVGDAVGGTVTIEGGAPLLTPETSTTSRQLSADELVAVPTSTRSFTQLLSAEAGVSSELSPVLTNGNGNISPSVNGTRTTSTSLFFNGVDATNITNNEGSLNDNIAPAPETLSEVKLQTSLYDASTGRSGGGNFQLITKSGTNNFNGSAYYFLQNEKFNANDFFFNRDGIERPRARRNEGGFTLGGPIVKEKLFFFGSYQRTRASTGFVPTATSQTTLPAALALINGPRTAQNVVAAFSALNPCVRNAGGAPVSGFCLTPGQISPIALNLLNLVNPITGDFLIPAPRNASVSAFRDQAQSTSNALLFGGNPLVRQRNVFPAEFEQDQFTLKLDQQFNNNNRLSGAFFYANFPGFDPFNAPNSQASPAGLVRDDRNRTLAISDVHIFSPRVINEVRFGYFSLNNSRKLRDDFAAITSASVGIPNPALRFDNTTATQRLGQFIGRNNLANFSFGGPNDSFNRRKQQTYSISDQLTYIRGDHNIRFGGEFKRFQFDTNLPEEQATEFEKFDNFTQFLAGRATEADTQFGITDKTFRFRDLSGFVTDDWKVNRKLTLNLGVRYEFFGTPSEKNGQFGNFDPSLLTNTENPLSGFVVPANAQPTGFSALDDALAVTTRANNNSTINPDRNNFAPRFGFAYSPLDSSKLVVRGGYGIFYDRPSSAFINTVFSNYPFLREIEVTAPTRLIQLGTAFSQQNPNLGLNNFLPNRIQLLSTSSSGTTPGTISYVIRDNTGVTRDANGANNGIDFATGVAARGNIAETFEFRAVDRNLRTPYIQQWNLGFQYELNSNMLIEARYIGTKGTKLLQAVALNEVFDLNNPNAPDYIFKRFNDAYEAAFNGILARNPGANPNSILRGPLRAAGSQRERGRGIAFGFPNTVTGVPVDYNLSDPAGNIIGFEARGAILGFNVPEALLLGSNGNSIYHSLQLNVQQRLSRGLQFNASYTLSRSIDTSSADPGSTAGGGRPDVPNTGFILQNDSRNIRSNRARSDFDRTHRFSLSFVYDIPTFGSNSHLLRGFQLSGFAQIQSGTPFSIFSAEPEVANVAQLSNTRLGSGGLFRPGFGRPNLCGSLEQLNQRGSDPTEAYFDATALCSSLGQYGNLPRNALRGPSQKRFDLGLSKTTLLTEKVGIEFRWDVFNVFNNVNFANPSGDLQDQTDFGRITNTVGGPRVMQFGAKLKF